jgi:cyclophilin family peptidyl-prolyl cis-trans isomerase
MDSAMNAETKAPNGPATTPAPSPRAAAARAVDATAFMDWAQTRLPAIFPGPQPTSQRTGFVVRYYPASGNFLAVTTAGDAYALGPVTNDTLVSLGNVSVFACAIYPDSCQAQINGVRPVAPLSYGKVAVLEVTGEALDLGISLVAPGCGDLSELAGSTPTQRRYNCKVNTPTSLAVDALRGDGTTAVTASFSVPAPQVTMTTSMGTIVLELDPVKAPISVDNFLRYTNDGFYANLLFHRVISNFVIQGGGVTPKPEKKPATYAPIKLESNNGLSNLRGSLAMARTNVPDSATSEFYINVVDNLGLNFVSAANPGYAVFGKVVQGLDVVDLIRVVPTTTRTADGLYQNIPVTNVVIQSVTQTR